MYVCVYLLAGIHRIFKEEFYRLKKVLKTHLRPQATDQGHNQSQIEYISAYKNLHIRNNTKT